MNYTIIDDAQVDGILGMKDAIMKMEEAFREHADGTLVAPARSVVDAGNGTLVFTVGASKGRELAAGFRVYETFPKNEEGHTQLVVCFDGKTGVLTGVVFGTRVGVIRTGAIGGVALDHLARKDATTLAMIGSGTQARSQLEAASIVREVKDVRVYSPTSSHREKFAEEMSEALRLSVTAVGSPEEAITGADIVISATKSKTPVYDAGLLEPGMHVTTLGPNLERTAEIEFAVVERSDVIVTDSVAQVDGYGEHGRPYFLSGTSYRQQMRELGKVVKGEVLGRTSEEEITLFCSVGLAGTEVFIANEALKRLRNR